MPRVTTKKTTAVTKRETALPSVYNYGELAGAGAEDITSEDYLLPFARMAQGLSPELKKRDEKYIEGLHEGQFFNTSTKRIYGEDDENAGYPFTVHVCSKQRAFAEFVPRTEGGGFIGQHMEHDPKILQMRAQQGKFGKLSTDDGTEIQETYYLFCVVPPDLLNPEPEAICLPFASTAITPVKQYLMRLAPVLKQGVPIYAPRVKIFSKPASNKKGDFMKPELVFDGVTPREYLLDPRDPLIQVCKDLRKSVASGESKVDYAAIHADGENGEDDKF